MDQQLESSSKSKEKGMPIQNIFVFGNSPALTELILMNASKYAFFSKGFSPFTSSPQDADVLLVLGPVSYKQAPVLKRVYQQMAAPKMVVAVGTRPLFESSNLLESIEELIPVDYYFANITPDPLELRELMSLMVPRGKK